MFKRTKHQLKDFKYPDEFVWNRSRYAKQVTSANKLITAYQEFVHSFREVNRGETSYGTDVVKKIAENFIVTEDESTPEGEKPKSKMSEGEIAQMNELKDLYTYFGQTITEVATKKKTTLEKIGAGFARAVKVLNEDQYHTDNARKDYEDCMAKFNETNKKIVKMEEELSDLEQKRKETKEMVKKEQFKEKEKRVMASMKEELEKFEGLQKCAIFVEQQTLDELEFQLDRLSFDFNVTIYQYIEEMRKYHESCHDSWSKLRKQVNVELNLKKFKKKPTVRKRTKVKGVRPDFLPQTHKQMIGVDLEEIMKREHERGAIPKHVKTMVDYLYKNEILDTVGVFRLAGRKEMVENFKRQMDMGKELDFSSVTNPSTVCELLKNYVRCLPESFCPMDIFDTWSQSKTFENMKIAFEKLSPANSTLFYHMLKLGKDTVAKAEKNKMNSKNMAVVWAPNLFKTPAAWLKDPGMMMTIAKKNSEMMDVYMFMIEYFDQLWPTAPPKPKFEKIKMEITREQNTDLFLKHVGRASAWWLLDGGQPKTENITNIEVDLSYREEEDDEDEGEEEVEGEGGDDMGGPVINLEDLEMKKEVNVTALEKCDVTNHVPFTAVETNDYWIIAGDQEGKLMCYELLELGIKPLPTFEMNEHHGAITTIIMLKPEDGIFLTGSEDKTVKYWRIGVRNSLATIETPNEKACRVAFKPPGQHFTIVSFGNEVFCYRFMKDDYTSLMTQYESVFESEITQLFDSYSRMFVATKSDPSIYCFDYDKPKCLQKMARRREKISAACSSTSKKVKVMTFFTSGKYACWESEKKHSVMDTFKKKRIKAGFELNAKKDYFVVLFDMGGRKDHAALVISNCGIISNYPQNQKVIGIRKYGAKYENKFYLWDEGNNIKCYDNKKVSKKFESPTRMTKVIPFYRDQFLLSVGEDKSIRIWDVR